MDDGNFVKKMYFGIIGERLAQRIQESTGYDFDGKNVTLRAGNVRKIAKDHGTEKTEAPRGQVPISANDYAYIPEIIGYPDDIKRGTYVMNGKSYLAATFSKVIDGQKRTLFMVDSGGSLDLFLQTMYVGKKIEA